MNDKRQDGSEQKRMLLTIGSLTGLKYAMVLYNWDKNIRDLVRTVKKERGVTKWRR